MRNIAHSARCATRRRAGIHRPGRDIFRPCAAFRRWQQHADWRIQIAADVLARRYCAACTETTP
jgi:hypothetical protein